MDFNELDYIMQNSLIKRYIKGETDIDIPNIIVATYVCGLCKVVRYVNVQKDNLKFIRDKITCTVCNEKNSSLNMKLSGENYVLVTDKKTKKKKFNLNNYFQ